MNLAELYSKLTCKPLFDSIHPQFMTTAVRWCTLWTFPLLPWGHWEIIQKSELSGQVKKLKGDNFKQHIIAFVDSYDESSYFESCLSLNPLSCNIFGWKLILDPTLPCFQEEVNKNNQDGLKCLCIIFIIAEFTWSSWRFLLCACRCWKYMIALMSTGNNLCIDWYSSQSMFHINEHKIRIYILCKSHELLLISCCIHSCFCKSILKR